jgi:dihydrofolate reductase
MGRVISNMSISLDGFIAGPKGNDKPNRELEGLDLLSDWMFGRMTERESVVLQEEKFKTVGAVIIGRRTFELGVGPWGENPTYHAPCFVLSRDAREKIVKEGGTSYTFVTDGIESAFEKARAAAGEKDIVVLGGANTVQQYIKAGFLDEINLNLVPVLLSEGIRLFEHTGADQIKLEQISVTDAPGVTHLRYRVLR